MRPEHCCTATPAHERSWKQPKPTTADHARPDMIDTLTAMFKTMDAGDWGARRKGRVHRARCTLDVPSPNPNANPRQFPGDGSFDGAGTWWAERIGPFVSMPGQRISILDGQNANKHPGKTSKQLYQATSLFDDLGADGRTAITGYVLGIVNDEGEVLGYPPIHYHHMTIRGLSDMVHGEDRADANWATRGSSGQSAEGVFVGVVADLFLTGGPPDEPGNLSMGETSVLFRGNFNGHPFVAKKNQRLLLSATYDDVRPEGSGPLKWWVSLALRGARVPGKGWGSLSQSPVPGFGAPISHVFLASMHDYVKSHHGTYNTMASPAHEEAFMWETARMPTSGHVSANMLGMVLWHHHANSARESLLLVGTPKQLGLTFGSSNGARCAASPSRAGFANNAALRDDLLARLPAIGKRWTGPKHLRPRVVCHALSNPIILGSELYSRRGPIDCTPFSFTTDTTLTEVFLSGPSGLAGEAPAKKSTAWGHSDWTIRFIADDGQSHAYSYETSEAKSVRSDCKLWWLKAGEKPV